MGAGLGAGEKAGKVTQKDEREQEWVGEEQEEGGDGLRAGGPESRPCGGGCSLLRLPFTLLQSQSSC